MFDEMLRGARAKPVLFGRQGDGIASLEDRAEILRNHVLAGLRELAQDGAEQRRPRCPFAPASQSSSYIIHSKRTDAPTSKSVLTLRRQQLSAMT
jgi:hypothetical protein